MSEDCQKCGTAMYELDEDRNCPGCSDRLEDDRDAPVPPAGDVEVVVYACGPANRRSYIEPGNAFLGWHAHDAAPLVDRVHATRLQAEVSALQRRLNIADQQSDDLNAGVARQQKTIDGINQMHTKSVEYFKSELTKARELNEHLSIALSELDSTLRVVAVAGSKTTLSSLRALAKRSLNIAHGLLSEQSAPTPFIAHNVDESCGQDAEAAKGES